MKTKKIWGFLALAACVLSLSFAAVSCGDDDDNNNGGNSSVNGGNSSDNGGNSSSSAGNGTGGGAVISSLAGTYVAITSSEYTTTVTFNNNGTGVITENWKGNSYSGAHTDVDQFTYSVSGQAGKLTFTKDGNVSGTKEYNLRVVNGFVFIEEQDGDIEFILYKSGQDLGTPNTSKLIGTWTFTNSSENNVYTVKGDGTGHAVLDYKSGNYNERDEIDFTYKMKNAYVGEYTYSEKEFDGTYTYTEPIFVLNDKIYLCDGDGEVDLNDILTKK